MKTQEKTTELFGLELKFDFYFQDIDGNKIGRWTGYFDNTRQLIQWYDRVRYAEEVVESTNVDGSFEWMSHLDIVQDSRGGISYIYMIPSIKTLNGDKSVYENGVDIKSIININLRLI